ncbi:hypothetical protein [Antribacter gilvus]|uniref:hypothetical protein n=1 Tax=Antribacter gilvus TaxID=2304675 RepID=UPI000F7A3C9B|nr:hypothetical protein [Antribacter gilvus]
MAHHPGDDAYTFDLVDESEQSEALAEPVVAPSGSVTRWMRRYHKVLVPVAAAGVAAAIAAVGAGEARERDRREAMSRAPGGMVSLETLPELRWRIDDVLEPVAVLDGLLVTRDLDGLDGVDPSTGEVRWSLAAGATISCWDTTSWFSRLPDVDRLVCLDERDVLVVRPGGALEATRPLTDRSGSPRPGPDGSLLRVQRVGPGVPAPQVTCDGSGTCRLPTGGELRGRDVVVRLEDAATGALRWEHTVAFEAPVDHGGTIHGCSILEGPSASRALLVHDDLEVVVRQSLVRITGCGIDAAFTSDGQELDQPFGSYVDEVYGTHLRVYPGWDEAESSPRAEILAPDGSVLHKIPGYPVFPLATDRSSDVMFTTTIEGLDAHRPDGTVLPLSTATNTQVLIVADGVVIFEEQELRTVRAVDLTSGENLWTWAVPHEVGLTDGSAVVLAGGTALSAFSDGRIALVVYARGATVGNASGYAGFGIGVRTGEVLWSGDLGTDVPFAAAGHLVTSGNENSVGLRGLG